MGEVVTKIEENSIGVGQFFRHLLSLGNKKIELFFFLISIKKIKERIKNLKLNCPLHSHCIRENNYTMEFKIPSYRNHEFLLSPLVFRSFIISPQASLLNILTGSARQGYNHIIILPQLSFLVKSLQSPIVSIIHIFHPPFCHTRN